MLWNSCARETYLVLERTYARSFRLTFAEDVHRIVFDRSIGIQGLARKGGARTPSYRCPWRMTEIHRLKCGSEIAGRKLRGGRRSMHRPTKPMNHKLPFRSISTNDDTFRSRPLCDCSRQTCNIRRSRWPRKSAACLRGSCLLGMPIFVA